MDREPGLVDSYPIRTHCHLSGVCDRKFGSGSPSWFLIMMTILFVSAVSHTQSRGLDESDTEGDWVESQEEGRKHTKWEFLESLREVTAREAPKWYDSKQDRFLPAVHLSRSVDRRKRPPNLFLWWATCRIDKAASGHDTDEQHRCMGWNSHGVSKVSVIDAAGVKQVSTSDRMSETADERTDRLREK